MKNNKKFLNTITPNIFDLMCSSINQMKRARIEHETRQKEIIKVHSEQIQLLLKTIGIEDCESIILNSINRLDAENDMKSWELARWISKYWHDEYVIYLKKDK